jgi:CDP-ribitol ribitolphosphotransferase
VPADTRGQRGSPYTLFLASSQHTAECYAEAFGEPLSKFVWDLGIPRTDQLVGSHVEQISRLRSRLGVPDGRKVILYAPTFRGDPATSAHSPNNLDLEVLRDVLGADHVLLLRPHPHARRSPVPDGVSSFAIDVSRYGEANDLLLVSDALITDYSSVVFEFALLERPIVLYAPDHESYERERGFYFDYRRDGPGPVFTRTEEVAAYLRAGECDIDRIRRFRDEWFAVADGRASERFVEQIIVPAVSPSE